MSPIDRNAFVARITGWLGANPGIYTHRVDGDVVTLLEAVTGKSRALSGDEIEEFHEGTNRMSGVVYPLLLFENGVQLAVTDLGFCFAPSFEASGEIPGAPPVVSFGDWSTLFGEAQLAAEDPGRRKDALDLLMLCIAIVDGARLAGFEVGPEEARMEALLAKLEGP